MAESQAVIFDLFGTLTFPTDPRLWDEMAHATASVLSADPDEVRKASDRSVPDRMVGRFGDVFETAHTLIEMLGVAPTKELVRETVDARLRVLSGSVRLRPEATSVLEALRERDVRVGVLSNAPPEVPELWPEWPLAGLADAVAFSSVIGCKKPDARAYQHVCGQLDAKPSTTYFVGDGSDNEINGALRAGLRAVWLQGTPGVRPPSPPAWKVISTIRAVPALLDEGISAAPG